jgi:Fe-S-cluster containining protein
MNENKQICIICAGKCCKQCPGAAFPEDFKLSKPSDNHNFLVNSLKSGKWCIDWWEGDPRKGHDEFIISYFIRPVMKGHENELTHAGWGGECIFLSDKGCTLPAGKRPKNCKMLEPRSDNLCILHNNMGKQKSCIAWIPFREVIKRIIGKEGNR